MHRVLGRLASVFALATLSLTGHATDIPLGFLTYDVTGTNVAQFDIVNMTGTNSSGDASFPIATRNRRAPSGSPRPCMTA